MHDCFLLNLLKLKLLFDLNRIPVGLLGANKRRLLFLRVLIYRIIEIATDSDQARNVNTDDSRTARGKVMDHGLSATHLTLFVKIEKKR